jgi:CBS domain-containing protein
MLEATMEVREAMTTDVIVVTPDQTLQTAAHLMQKHDCGVLPVGENDKLVGMITDRDMAVRAIAQGKGPNTKVREVMTEEVKYCFDDQDLAEVMKSMGVHQIRRLPVINRGKRLVGVVSLGDIARANGSEWQAGAALRKVARPGGEHRQA